MGTRGLIAIENSDGTFTSIYTHWDSYPSNNGKILLEHYTNENKVQNLMSLGNLSILGSEIGNKHDFEKHNSDKRTDCLAYGRDRGENDTNAAISDSRKALTSLANNYSAEFLYLFSNGVWNYKPLQDNIATVFRKLTQKSCQE